MVKERMDYGDALRESKTWFQWKGEQRNAEGCWYFTNGHWEKKSSTMKREAFLMYLLLAVLLNFSIELRQKLIYMGKALLRFLPAWIKDGDSSVEDHE